jgi:hypothetical protein
VHEEHRHALLPAVVSQEKPLLAPVLRRRDALDVRRGGELRAEALALRHALEPAARERALGLDEGARAARARPRRRT